MIGKREGLSFDAEVSLGVFRLEAAFEVGGGETIALVGPSGSGKSSCLNLIAGLLRPDRATISLGGNVLCDTGRGVDLPPEQRRVGLLFQEYALFPHMTVRGNVEYGLRARRRPRKEVEEVAHEWLERMRLSELADRPVTRLSGGQRQRVALARAAAAGARALLLDEPFGALDLSTRSAVRGELRAFLDDAGLPAVVVTHDPFDARVFGDRIVVLEEGRMVQSGPKEALLAAPRSPFVAALAGLNLYRAAVSPGTGLKDAWVGDLAFHVLADELAGPVYLAFTPSEVTLSQARSPGSARNTFEGMVREVLPLPDRLRVILDIGVPLTVEITRSALESLHVAPGQRLWATVKATAIQVYR